MIRLFIKRHIVYLGAFDESTTFSPPEVISAFYISRNKKDCDRYSQLTRQLKSVSVVIIITIVKRQYKWCTLIMHDLFLFCIELFQSLFQMHHTIVTIQVAKMTTQVSAARMMIV